MASRSGLDTIRRLVAWLAVILALATSAPSFAGGDCCPMSTTTAPCHTEAMAGCHMGCGFCQVQAPQTRWLAASPIALSKARTLPDIDIYDQLLAQPATPPPRREPIDPETCPSNARMEIGNENDDPWLRAYGRPWGNRLCGDLLRRRTVLRRADAVL
jgi:hypothetical protein